MDPRLGFTHSSQTSNPPMVLHNSRMVSKSMGKAKTESNTFRNEILAPFLTPRENINKNTVLPVPASSVRETKNVSIPLLQSKSINPVGDKLAIVRGQQKGFKNMISFSYKNNSMNDENLQFMKNKLGQKSTERTRPSTIQNHKFLMQNAPKPEIEKNSTGFR